ncbi:hypothetical protein D3C81_1360850 [compost metagenome]
MPGQVALGQVVAGPAQQLREGLPVITHQGEEQRIALPFRGGDQALIARVDDPAIRTHQFGLETLPGRPRAGRCGIDENGQAQGDQPYQPLTHHHPASPRRRLPAQRNARHSKKANSTTQMAAIAASNTGCSDKWYHSSSHHGSAPTK